MSRQILVIGNHRTGSSCVAGIIHKIGVIMGDEMLGAHPSNPRGHFEDREFLLYNDSLVVDWDDPMILAGKDLRVPRIRYSKMISSRDKKRDIWGVKDPRLCIVARYFMDLLFDPRIVVPHRSTEAMVQSLVKRNGVSLVEAENIVRLYDRELGYTLGRAAEIGIPIHSVQYEDLLADTSHHIDQLAGFVFEGMKTFYNRTVRDSVCNFVEPGLNHASSD